MSLFLIPFGIGIIGLLSLALQIYAIVDIARSNFRNPNDKIIWIIVCIIFSFIGPLLYFMFGRDQKIRNF